MKTQGIVHSLIALLSLVICPLACNEFLEESVFFSPSFVWVRHGELKGWVSPALDRFFLAPPYWSSYHPGWLVGLLPGLLAAIMAWGLWKGRAWARQLAIAFHGIIAIVSLGVAVWFMWPRKGGGGGPDSLAGVAAVAYGIIGGIVLGVFISASVLLWWFCRVATRNRFESTGRRGIRTILV